MRFFRLFQSTLPVGGATYGHKVRKNLKTNFNPRSPWGERPEIGKNRIIKIQFQSTLPVGGATCPGFLVPKNWRFQSTLPVGGATGLDKSFELSYNISIHAPRGGSDLAVTGWKVSPGNFNPRSPWGERLTVSVSTYKSSRFQSTLPVGGATHCS